MEPLEGSCLCGGVRFRVTEAFETMTYCHCASCKKLSGGAGTVNGRARSAAIAIDVGEALLRSFQPGEGSTKTFCSACGSNLFGGGWPDSERCSVRLSALDSALEGMPQSHIFVRSLASWETLPSDGAPRYDMRAG